MSAWRGHFAARGTSISTTITSGIPNERYLRVSGSSPLQALVGRLGVGGGDTSPRVRFVGGSAFWPHGVPPGIFVEIAPLMDLIPSTTLTANGGLGIRFFFRYHSRSFITL